MEKVQRKICIQYGAEFVPSPAYLKLGIARNVRDGVLPINGLRHLPTGDTTGWYIWGGTKSSEDPDFFLPLHVQHITSWSPLVEQYLGLAPGWRFLVDKTYEDVWYDESLLQGDC